MRRPIMGHGACPLSSFSPAPVAAARGRGAAHRRRRPLPRALTLPVALALFALLLLPASRPAAADGIAPRTVSAASAPALSPPSFVLAPDVAAVPYGTAVAISGDTAAVTGRVGTQAVVFVFFRTAAGWVQQAAIADAAGADPASVFGSALAISGDLLAVGAGAEDAPVSSVYVYARAGGVWSPQSHLQPGRASELGFGAALALAGDTLVVGVPGSSESDYSSTPGAAFVYVRAGAGWVRQAVLAAESPAAADRFGQGVAVAHQHVVVGGQGFAEIFDFAGPGWQRTAALRGSGAGTAFGSAVAASNETAAVADPSSQRVSVFIHTSAGWFHQAEIAPPAGATPSDEFGAAIALSQDALAIGAPGTAGACGPDSGAVYAYVKLRHRWLLESGFALPAPPAGDRFGSTVAITLHAALVGSNATSPVPTEAWVLDRLDHP